MGIIKLFNPLLDPQLQINKKISKLFELFPIKSKYLASDIATLFDTKRIFREQLNLSVPFTERRESKHRYTYLFFIVLSLSLVAHRRKWVMSLCVCELRAAVRLMSKQENLVQLRRQMEYVE